MLDEVQLLRAFDKDKDYNLELGQALQQTMLCRAHSALNTMVFPRNVSATGTLVFQLRHRRWRRNSAGQLGVGVVTVTATGSSVNDIEFTITLRLIMFAHMIGSTMQQQEQDVYRLRPVLHLHQKHQLQ